MTDNELYKKLQNAEDSSEEEDMEAAAYEEKLEKEHTEIEMTMERDFYMIDEKKQRNSLREGLKFNIRRNKSIDEYINYERNAEELAKEDIIEHIRSLLLKKKSPVLTKSLYRTDQ